MELVNLTPHNVNFMDEDGNVLKTIKPAAEAPRLKTFKGTSSQIDVDGVSIPLSGGFKFLDELVDGQSLPPPEDGVLYIVSKALADYAVSVGRTDFVSPDRVVRDDKGAIIGCRGLASGV